MGWDGMDKQIVFLLYNSWPCAVFVSSNLLDIDAVILFFLHSIVNMLPLVMVAWVLRGCFRVQAVHCSITISTQN